MKVGLLGNMNNNFFGLVQYLRSQGIDAELCLFSTEASHFHPSADSYDLGYQDYTHVFNWGADIDLRSHRKTDIRADLKRFDVIVGCGLAPAFMELVDRRLDVFCPYGADLYDSTNYRIANPFVLRRSWPAVFYQRRGIRKAPIIHLCRAQKHYDIRYEELRAPYCERWYESIPMIYAPNYSKTSVEKNIDRTHWGREFQLVRESCELMVVYHGRQVWCRKPGDPNIKGSDRLIRGWKIFLERTKSISAKLVLLEYGSDVPKSKELIEELGIAGSVHWFPKMMRKDIMAGLHMTDIACGMFEYSATGGGVFHEAQVAGKPILTYRNEKNHSHEKLYPIMNAREPADIAQALVNYVDNPKPFMEMGIAGRDWYEQEIGAKTVGKYVNLLASLN